MNVLKLSETEKLRFEYTLKFLDLLIRRSYERATKETEKEILQDRPITLDDLTEAVRLQNLYLSSAIVLYGTYLENKDKFPEDVRHFIEHGTFELNRRESKGLKDVIVDGLKRIHTSVAVVGGRIRPEYDPKKKKAVYKVHPITGNVTSKNIERIKFVPFVILSGDVKRLMFAVAYFDENKELQVKYRDLMAAGGKFSRTLAKLIASGSIPFFALTGHGSSPLYLVYKALVEEARDVFEEITKLIEKRYQEVGVGEIVPIGIAHSIPREGLYYIYKAGGFKELYERAKRGELEEIFIPIRRPIFFEPKIEEEPKEDLGMVVYRGEYGKLPRFNKERIEKVIKEMEEKAKSRNFKVDIFDPNKVEDERKLVDKLREEFDKTNLRLLIYAHTMAEATRRDAYEISIYLGYKGKDVGVKVTELLGPLKVVRRGVAVLATCLGAAAKPLIPSRSAPFRGPKKKEEEEEDLTLIERSVSVSLLFASRGYRSVIGSVRESLDISMTEVAKEVFNEMVERLENANYADALVRARMKLLKEKPYSDFRALPVLYEIVPE